MPYVEMFTRPRLEIGGAFGCQWATWDLLCELGEQYGWKPAGTIIEPSQATDWSKHGGFDASYKVADFPLIKRVRQEDSAAWAEALDRAAIDLGEGILPLKGPGTRALSDRYPMEAFCHLMFGVRAGFLRRFANFLRKGAFIFMWEDGADRIPRNEDQTQIDDMFDFARSAHLVGDFKHAAEMYGELVKSIPGDAGLWHNLGLVRRELGEFEGAIEAHLEATRLAPAGWDVWQAYANTLREAGRGNEAVLAARRAVDLAPSVASCWSSLGSALKEAKDTEGSLGAHQKALDLEPGDPKWICNMAVTLSAAGRTQEAIRLLRPAADAFSDFCVLQENLADYLIEAGQHREAICYLDRWLAQEPKNLRALRRRVFCFLELKDPNGTLCAVKAHLQAEPDFLTGWKLLLELTDSIEEQAEAKRKIAALS